jgi:5'-nucleotidase / UDP-sugar diphosphatase
LDVTMKRPAGLKLLFSLLLLLLPVPAFPQKASLTIFHTNDTHGHLLPFSYPDADAGSDIAQLSHRKNIGGIARRAALVKRLRKELNKTGTAVLLVDTGDITDGTPFSTKYDGEADVAAMNAASYDYSTLGNHEFNTSLAKLKKLLSLFRYPVLCANAVENSGRPLTQASDIKNLGPLKIGIFGLVTREAASYQAAREGVNISDEIETSRRMARSLRPRADIVIALSHSGEKVDERIAAAVPGINVIIGGHSHSRLPSGRGIPHSGQSKASDVNETIIVQAYQWGGELGRLDLDFEKDRSGTWHISKYHELLIPITSAIPEDPEVAAVVARYWKPIAARYGAVIGKAAADFVVRGDDLAQYNLIADAIRETFRTDIEFENLGGVRAELSKGKITFEDMVNMDPFKNTVVTFSINGSRLKEILTKNQPAVSGIEYKLVKGRLTKATVQGQAIKEDRIYTGATNSYFAAMAMKGLATKETGQQRINVVMDYIRRKGTVKPSYDSRRVIIQ